MRNEKCRFVLEYTNFRKRQFQDDIRYRKKCPVTDDPQYEKECIEILQDHIDTINKYYRACRAGLITVNEYMHKISGIGGYYD